MAITARRATGIGGLAVTVVLTGGIAIAAAPASGAIDGSIIGTGIAADGFTITLDGPKGYHDIEVAADGSFSQSGITPGRYSVDLWTDNGSNSLYDTVGSVQIRSDTTLTKDIGYSLVSGTITRGGTPAPARRAVVSTQRQGGYFSGDTDNRAGGSYRLLVAMDGLREERLIHVWSSDRQWASQWYENAATEREATPVLLEAGSNPIIDFDLTRTATVKGALKLPKGSKWIERWIELRDANGEVTDGNVTNRKGAFTLKGLAAGTYTLEFGRSSGTSLIPGFYFRNTPESKPKAAKRLIVRSGETKDLGKIAIPASGRIKGRIVNGKGKGRAKLRVVAVPVKKGVSTRSAHTNRKGVYTITGLTPGAYKVHVWNSQYPHPKVKACKQKMVKKVTVRGKKVTQVGKRKFKVAATNRC